MRVVSNQLLDQLEHQRTDRISRDEPPALRRAVHLLPSDRVLIELVVRERRSVREISRLLGQSPGTLSRRVNRIGRRLSNPIVDALLDDSLPLAEEYRQLGIEHFLQGLSASALADKHRISPARIHHIIQFLQFWHRGITRR